MENARASMIRNAELWGGIFWLALGAYVAWSGRGLGLGELSEPGAGFALFWIGILMCALAFGILGRAVLSGGPALASLWDGTRWRKVLVVIGLLLVYATGFQAIGFIPCTLALLLILMWFIDPVRWWVALIIAVVSTVGIWAAMSKWLKIQLPSGILSGILG
jgi:putative tricarboxylic transport membrane protein